MMGRFVVSFIPLFEVNRNLISTFLGPLIFLKTIDPRGT